MPETSCTDVYDRIDDIIDIYFEPVPCRPARVYIFEFGQSESRVSEVFRGTGNRIYSVKVPNIPNDSWGRGILLARLRHYKEKEGIRT